MVVDDGKEEVVDDVDELVDGNTHLQVFAHELIDETRGGVRGLAVHTLVLAHLHQEHASLCGEGVKGHTFF